MPRVLTALLLLSVCAGAVGANPGQAKTKSSPGVGTRASAQLAGCVRAERFDEADFPARPQIDHRFLPLVPGTQLILKGVSNVTGQPSDHVVTFTVTDLTKRIGDVATLVVYDVDASGGQVTEAELTFFAQDADGNVWNLGEYPEEYGEDGEFLGAPSTWIAGEANAEAGIHMLADPQVGGPRYLQGWAPKIHFLDCASVIEAGQTTTVLGGTFTDVLVTEETNPFEPRGGSQLKHHAPGVGIVRVGFVDDPEGEVLELFEANELSPTELTALREAALQLDDRGYLVSEVYRATGRPTQL